MTTDSLVAAPTAEIPRADSSADPPRADSPAIDPPAPAVELHRWPAWQRVLFRYALLHYVLIAFPGPIGSLWQTLTGALALADVDLSGRPWTDVQQWLSWPDQKWQALTTWMSQHGLAPYEVIHQRTGSGDTGHAYAQLLVVVVASVLGAAIWSVLSRARGYPRLGRWLHLIVRWDLAFTMFGYGFAKFYGGQFGQLSLTRLTQEIGDTWPMTMVGTFMQASKPYELFGGACEVLGGFLLFHRRTALLGAVVAIVTLTNICALNWLYGVPVKLYSAHLLLYGVALLAPFAPQLCAVFVRNRPSQPVDLRVVRSRWLGALLLVFGFAWVGTHLFLMHRQRTAPQPWREALKRSALYGLWTVETMILDGAEVPMTDSSRWRDFAIDAGTLAWARELSGKRHTFDFDWDEATNITLVKPRGSDAEAEVWNVELGTKTVKGDPPLLLRNEHRGKPVDVERRSLVLLGKWGEKELELHAVEKKFRLETEFRLRQELPDFW